MTTNLNCKHGTGYVSFSSAEINLTYEELARGRAAVEELVTLLRGAMDRMGVAELSLGGKVSFDGAPLDREPEHPEDRALEIGH